MSKSFADQVLEDFVFEGKDLTNVSFRRAQLYNCTFRNCQLRGMDVRKAKLVNCNFENCEMVGFDPSGAEIEGGNIALYDGRKFGRDYLYVMTPQGVSMGCAFLNWRQVANLKPRDCVAMGGRLAVEASRRSHAKVVGVGKRMGWIR